MGARLRRSSSRREILVIWRRALLADAGREAHLQHQGRDQRDQIGIAAALAQAVQRALHLARAGAHGGERIRHRVLGIVMGMDAEPAAGNVLDDLADDALDLVRQRAAIGVAEHDPARAGALRRLHAVQRIGRVGLVAVEEMLGVEHRLALARYGQAPRSPRSSRCSRDALDAERDLDMEIPGLADDADAPAPCVPSKRGKAGIVGGAAARPAGHAEGDELRAA